MSSRIAVIRRCSGTGATGSRSANGTMTAISSAWSAGQNKIRTEESASSVEQRRCARLKYISPSVLMCHNHRHEVPQQRGRAGQKSGPAGL
jgi:hypothetical protein